MKIFLCVHHLADGGAERVASLWAEGFARYGHEVHIVICEGDVPNDYYLPERVITHSFFIHGNYFVRYARLVLKLYTLLKKEKPDLAIGVLFPWVMCLLLVAKPLGIPIINTEHNAFETPKTLPMSLRLKIEKFFLNKFYDGVTVLTQADKDIAIRYFKNVFILPNPLAFSQIIEKNHSKNVILAVGRLYDWKLKGFDVLIKAWGRIAPDYPEWSLRIAGRGKDKDLQELSEIVHSMGVEKQMEFVGFRKDILELYKEAEIYVMSSRCEGFGMSLIEAMSQGCACIACDYHGRQKEIINENAGVICPTDDVAAMACCIRELIDDKNLRESIQKRAIKRSHYYDLDKTMTRWFGILDMLGIHQ